MSGELLLVGSVPLATPEEVFATFGAPLGKYLFAMPDGEVGPRRHWISRVHYQVLAAHPELEVEIVVSDRTGNLVADGFDARGDARSRADAGSHGLSEGLVKGLR